MAKSSTKELSRFKLLDTILDIEGTYCVKFKKQDGTMREMRARQNVQHNLKGYKNTVAKPSNSYLATFDVDKFAYRTINLATITELTIGKDTYKIV